MKGGKFGRDDLFGGHSRPSGCVAILPDADHGRPHTGRRHFRSIRDSHVSLCHPDDDHVCEVCATSNGRVYLPSQVAKKIFTSRWEMPTTNSCIGVLIGLYGAWLEARGVLENLRRNIKNGGIQLSAEEVRALVNGQWERCISADTDRLGIQMIEALSYEKVNQEIAIQGYRYVVEEAREVRHLLLLVPAYLRLLQLLLRAGEEAEALEMIERFESRFPSTKRGAHFPSEKQRETMKAKKLNC